jgi:hypothetical protein
MELATADVLCVYGIGSGELYAHFKEWLDDDCRRSLLFIEEREDAFNASLSMPFFHDPQVKIFLSHPEVQGPLLTKIAWEYIFLRFFYLVNPCYLDAESRAQELFAHLKRMQLEVELLAADHSDFGVKILTNLRENSLLLPEAHLIKGLTGAFAKIPAIICGGGPSLSKNGAQLADLKDRALIFAGGSTLKILSNLHILPHFQANIDPDPPYERFLEQTGFELPFVYQSRVSRRLLSLVHGTRLWTSDSGVHPIERWLAEELALPEEPFKGGWNVGNFCLALSLLLGCHPIIFVGIDLCAHGEQLYGEGIDEKIEREKFILVQDQSGAAAYARRDWAMAARWIEETIHLHQERTLFINATEGGIGFKGALDLTLREASETYLNNSFDLEGSIHTALQQLDRVPTTKERVEVSLQKIVTSLERAEKQCNQLIALMSSSYPHSPLETGEFILNEFELKEELAYDKLLEPLWTIWKYMIQRESLHVLPSEEFERQLNQLLFFKRTIENIWTDMK